MKRVKHILSTVLEIEISEIHEDLSPDDVETWDSFNGLMLVSELESAFNVKFTIDEVTTVKCVRDIKHALVRCGINLIED